MDNVFTFMVLLIISMCAAVWDNDQMEKDDHLRADIICKDNKGYSTIDYGRGLHWKVTCENGAVFKFRNDDFKKLLTSTTEEEI